MAKHVNTRRNFKLEEQLREFTSYRNNLPRIIGNEHVNFSKQSFSRQGFIEEQTVKKWEPRKPVKGSSKRNKSRAILVKTGRLRRSPRITQISKMQVSTGSDVPYARIHNEGGPVKGTARVKSFQRRGRRGKHTVKAHTRRINFDMPQRKFMGYSDFFDRRIMMQIRYRTKRIFNTK